MPTIEIMDSRMATNRIKLPGENEGPSGDSTGTALDRLGVLEHGIPAKATK